MKQHAHRTVVRVLAMGVAMVGAGLAPLIMPVTAQAITDFTTAGERANVQYGPWPAGGTATAPFWDPDNSPTASKPQSKLWYAQGKWWGVLLDNGSKQFHIWSFDAATHKWSNTGTVVDSREKSHVDVLWDAQGQHLFTVGAVYAATTTSADSIKFNRYSYDSATGKYKVDIANKTLNNGGVEAAVIAKDGHNRLWVTYTAGNNVRYIISDDLGVNFSNPTPLPANMVPKSEGLNPDDIATVVGANDSASIAWSRQEPGNMEGLYVATYTYSGTTGTAGTWKMTTLLENQYVADDHLNMSVDGDGAGRVFMVAKEGTNDNTGASASDPLIRLWVRELNGTWNSHVVSTVGDGMTRPIVVVDRDANKLRVYLTSPEAGGSIYEKTTSLSSPTNFASGKGKAVIQLGSDTFINNITTTKQNVTPNTGLLLLASDQKTGYYVQNYAGGGSSPTPTPTPTAKPTVVMKGAGLFVARSHMVSARWAPAAGSAPVDRYRWITSAIGAARGSRWSTERGGGTAAGVSFEGTPGKTYCIRVQGVNAAGGGEFSAGRCVTVPMDDRALARRGAWQKARAPHTYMGTVLKTRSRGATVTKTVTGKRVALIVTKLPGGGRVLVFRGNQLVKSVSLRATRLRSMQLVPIADRRRVTTATYRVVVVSRRAPVLLDGFVVSRR